MGFIEWIGAFFVGSLLSGLTIRFLLGSSQNLQKGLLRKGYDQGYWDASINLRMYYNIMNKTIPPSDWLRHTMGRRLDTRVKFIDLMNTDEKVSWTLK
tara:strand:+ start:372 stop:665 length:294 start_codon:yes stop_codon:yes gene_type:complete